LKNDAVASRHDKKSPNEKSRDQRPDTGVPEKRAKKKAKNAKTARRHLWVVQDIWGTRRRKSYDPPIVPTEA